MFNFFKKKEKENLLPELFDLKGDPLAEGDIVIAQRYELNECRIVLEDRQYFYISIADQQKISYIKMIDAISGYQKVLKVHE
ncbi:MAG: hypothetical protein KI790_05835 [Cyclobacteriaceae bacterium]|nr:hypothetical protein [Cyclobacteriaceae bacterium HetDA_MAG_MS6]